MNSVLIAEKSSSHNLIYGSIDPPTSNKTITLTVLDLSGTICISKKPAFLAVFLIVLSISNSRSFPWRANFLNLLRAILISLIPIITESSRLLNCLSSQTFTADFWPPGPPTLIPSGF